MSQEKQVCGPYVYFELILMLFNLVNFEEYSAKLTSRAFISRKK